MMPKHKVDVFELVDPHSNIACTINSLCMSESDRPLAREYLRDGELEVIIARERQMQREEGRRLFGLAVSALARGASRLARIGAAAAVHAALTEKDRERPQHPVQP